MSWVRVVQGLNVSQPKNQISFFQTPGPTTVTTQLHVSLKKPFLPKVATPRPSTEKEQQPTNKNPLKPGYPYYPLVQDPNNNSTYIITKWGIVYVV